MQKILIIDDNVHLTHLLCESLVRPTRWLDRVYNVQQAFEMIKETKYDLLIVDRNLPDGDGLDLVTYFEEQKIETPLLVISDKNMSMDRVWGLRQGADDYLCKPFCIEELVLRVEKLLQRPKVVSDAPLKLGKMVIYPNTGLITVGEQQIFLRKREFTLFYFLARHKGRVVSREMLVNNIWSEEEEPSQETVDVYIRRIRMLLGPHRKVIKTIRGFGYMVEEL